ncbi:PIN domain-containing protein [Sulfolobus sp. S-194]|uniref:type II toxin-antitoxin system VapC family toxin n=1 Tax=Sulfolobus sp. S-194 TaxID=2512240 RepID=UPI001436E535|nr:PIN domain-containing protein [Sulfolobus sp. S-194]QIW23999.1 PIN domain-containing protein [Sulfolobus sp. S-194]
MVKLLLDTSYFIAYLNKNDKHHSEALKLSEKVREYEAVITDYVFDELITFLIYHVNKDYAIKVASIILEKVKDGELYMFFIDWEVFIHAINYLVKYEKKLSFTDCTTLSSMDKLRSEYLLSFDNDFDNITLLKLGKKVVNIRYII